MLVTINTDASYHPQHKVGAYAFWIISNQGRFLKAGAFKELIENSTQAEAQCIINAIYYFKKQDWKEVTKIIINTDALNAIAIFKKTKSKIKKYNLRYGNSLSEKFDEITKGFPSIEFRHVKAHKKNGTARNWVNDWCDKSAKEMLWKEINNTKK